jgi:quinoprotein glucose dehydrogenase
VIYINANDIAWTGGLTEEKAGGVGSTIYHRQCALCHGINRRGAPAFPSLIEIDKRISDAALAEVIHSGKGRMAGFPNITGSRLTALIEFLKTGNEPSSVGKGTTRNDSANAGTTASALGVMPKYRFTGYQKFLDPDGYPAIVPPWGTLNAIDLNTGKYLWKIPLGEYPELAAKGLKGTGTENYGGPIVTAGGLVVIASTIYDRKIRALDSRTGELLWDAHLPYAGNATPATYMVDGKQYIVIATSGARDPKGPQGAAYVAFALP